MSNMDAKAYWDSVGKQAVIELCEQVGTSYGYYKQIANKRKRPSIDLARKMVAASGGQLSLDKLLFPLSERRTSPER